MDTLLVLWALWDADELVSVHLTEEDARNARESHLERYADFGTDDCAELPDAVTVRLLRALGDRAPRTRSSRRLLVPMPTRD